jgi:transcriptional regulator with XRE-family HTH domain
MRCEACGATVGRWSTSPLCPACYTITGSVLPPPPARNLDTVWLWMSDSARAALATGDLRTIMRAYRAATATSQRQLAERLGYDTTYISMIETGRREITDVAALRRIAEHLGVPARTLGVADRGDADFTAMLQFAESTIRLAVITRQAGHGAEAVNELWPVVIRLEARAADGHVDRDVMHLLARARAELGVSLGYVLPEERLSSAARWTSRALRLATLLDDPSLQALTLRIHGNELRKAGRTRAAVARLHAAMAMTMPDQRGTVIAQLARAAGDLGDAELFDSIIRDAYRINETNEDGAIASREALHEVHVRGLVHTGRSREAMNLIASHVPSPAPLPAQWQAMYYITVGEAILANRAGDDATEHFRTGIKIAEAHRLPHQIQRAARTTTSNLPEVHDIAEAALDRVLRRI